MAKALPLRFFREYGQKLGIEPALLKAVQLVESGSYDGFLASGRVQILFEGHIFYKLIRERVGLNSARALAKLQPSICYPTWNRIKYLGGEKEWPRLEKAMEFYPEFAQEAASWGMFQIMGFNYAQCGCRDISEFVELMAKSREDQFILGINFMENTGCLKWLKDHKWTKFAKAYNGPGFAQNKYDVKLENTYKRVTNDF